jgi:tetratricopeptide (TPR) repeat protein
MHRPHGNEYTQFYIMDFLTGQAKLNKLEKDADIHLKKFVTFYTGQNMIKDAYKRLSWFYLLEGDSLKFNTYRGLARKYGAVNSDEDKNAQRESEAGIYPDVTLLKARLLFDGGYYTKAEETIKNHSANFKTNYQHTEYYYRYARITHEANKLSKAIELYNQTIKVSGNNNLYFAPNSCLQLGYIYERLGFKELAKIHFQKALAYKGYEYKSSISQKAKAALSKYE